MIAPYYEEPGITIYCADCRDVLPQLPKVDLVLTDPPYGGPELDGSRTPRKFGLNRQHNWNEPIPPNLIHAVCVLADICVLWGGNHYANFLSNSRGWLCWYKPDAPPTMGNFELAWTNQDRNTRLITYSIAATNAERVKHPTQKPRAVILWTLIQFSDAKSVIDPFMGSGTTLVAAKQLGRRAIGIEIEPRYCDIAIERLRQDVLPLAAATEPEPLQESMAYDV